MATSIQLAFWKPAIWSLKPFSSPFTSQRDRRDENTENVALSTEIKISFGKEVQIDQVHRGQIIRAATSA
jgi:hypothetical protein